MNFNQSWHHKPSYCFALVVLHTNYGRPTILITWYYIYTFFIRTRDSFLLIS